MTYPPHRLAQYRAAAELSLRELGRRSGVDAAAINKMELGTQDLCLRHMVKFAEVLGIKPHQLIEE